MTMVYLVKYSGAILPSYSVTNTPFPLEGSHGYVLYHRTSAWLPTVIARKEHLQPSAMWRRKVHRNRFTSIVTLPNKTAKLSAKPDG